jgi:hypothetical protein
MNILYSLQHSATRSRRRPTRPGLGRRVPGPSYLDEDSGGPENDAGGIPAHGNQRSEWDAGCRFDYANPEYR